MPDLDPNCLKIWWIMLKEFFKKDDFQKNQQTTIKNNKFTIMQRVNKTAPGIFRPEFGTRGLLNLGKKHLDHQNWEELTLDRHFK